MTDVKPHIAGTAWMLLLALLFSMLAGNLTDLPPPTTENYIQNAAIIKTQSAADYLQRQGARRGIDVSKHQGSIDWSKVANSGVDFVFVRTSYGAETDPYFVANARAAHNHGLKVGAYLYATFKNQKELREQADHFIQQLDQVTITYPVVLDMESPIYEGMSRNTVTGMATEFLERVKAAGYDVMFYSYNNFIRDRMDVHQISKYDLWIANYLEEPTVASPKIWQHTSSGSVSGIKGNVDINIAYGDFSSQSQNKSTADDTGDAPVIRVSKSISNTLKTSLNDRYGAGLPLEGLDMEQMNQAIATGLQKEIGKQWGVDLPVTGVLGTREASYLSEVPWSSSTGGNITYLLQTKLFYKGYYSQEPSGQYDSNTMAAVQAFQQANQLEGGGTLNYNTLCALLTT